MWGDMIYSMWNELKKHLPLCVEKQLLMREKCERIHSTLLPGGMKVRQKQRQTQRLMPPNEME